MIVVAVNEWKGRRGESWVRSDWFEWLIEWVSDSLWVFKIEVEWVSEHHKLKEKATTRPHEECFTQTLEKKRKEKKNIVAIMLTRPPLHYSTNSNHPRLLLRSFSPDSLFLPLYLLLFFFYFRISIYTDWTITQLSI